MSRSTGLTRDLRLSRFESYGNYYYLNFKSYVGSNGDCYDRYLLRMSEMLESINIINQITYKMSNYSNKNRKNKKIKKYAPHKLLNILKNKEKKNSIHQNEYQTMEALINHFKYWGNGAKVKSSVTYQSVESPKGEFGVTLISDSTNKPYRCKVRSPAYHSLQAFPVLAKGHFLADLVTLVGTMDIVFGEIDR